MEMEDIVRKQIGKRIREIRTVKALSQEELGDKADLNYKFISELERGKVNISLDSIVRISQALGVYISDLFRIDEEPIKIKESKLSPLNRNLIKKAIRLLTKVR